MNTSETSHGSTEPTNAAIELHQVDVESLLAMSEENREQFLSKFNIDNYSESLSMAQVQALWKRRNELDKEMFYLMIDAAISCSPESDENDGGCPFTGLQADATVDGWYGSTWMDRMDHRALPINSSVAKELVDLAQRVGAGVEALRIDNEQETLFYWDEDEELVNNIGALNGEKTFAELAASEREAVLTDEAKDLIHSAVKEVLKACPDKYRATKIIRGEIDTLIQQ